MCITTTENCTASLVKTSDLELSKALLQLLQGTDNISGGAVSIHIQALMQAAQQGGQLLLHRLDAGI